MSRLLPLFLALLWAASPALGQKLKDKTRPANDAVQCPYTGGDAELLAAIGIQAVGGFPFSIHPSTKDLDEYFGDDLTIWLETEHFRLGYGLGPYKVGGDERNELRAELTALQEVLPEVNPKARSLDSWLRAYLYAVRLEKLWVDMLELLNVEADIFPDGSKPWDTTGKFMGTGPNLGMKGKFEVLLLPSESASTAYLRDHFGLATKLTQRWNLLDRDAMHLVVHTGQGSLKKDRALYGHVVFNQTQQMLNAYKHYSYEIPVWLLEGVAHWMERRISPKYNTFDSSEGATAETTRKEDWEPPTRKMVNREEAVSMARLVNVKGFGELKLEHHFTTWSMIDFLVREHPQFLGVLMDRISGMTNEQFIPDGSGLWDVHREVFKESLGMSYAQFDRAWQSWVLENYRAQ